MKLLLLRNTMIALGLLLSFGGPTWSQDTAQSDVPDVPVTVEVKCLSVPPFGGVSIYPSPGSIKDLQKIACGDHVTLLAALEPTRFEPIGYFQVRTKTDVVGWMAAKWLPEAKQFADSLKIVKIDSTMPSITCNPSSGSTTRNFYEVRVTGTGRYSGSYALIEGDGTSKMESIDGVLPYKFTATAAMISVVLQKQSTATSMSVQILRNGCLVNSGHTSTDFGMVALSAR